MRYIFTLKLMFKVNAYRKPLQNCFKTFKYCDNTCKNCTCSWPHFSSTGSILVSTTNTYEYCHNTCEYWAGEYTLSVLEMELYYIEWRHQLKVKYLTGPLLDACLQKIILSSAGGSDSKNSRRAYYTIQTNKHVFLQFCSNKIVVKI